jgi:uncharacterized membrane protein YgcG
VGNTFTGSTVYTAMITLSPRSGYTLTGITANFFTVSGSSASNGADSGVVTAVFPVTIAVPDMTPPTLTAANASGTNHNSTTLNFTSDEAGIYYYLVYAAADPAPGVTAVKAQGAAAAKGAATAAAGVNTAYVRGLAASTAYKAYVVVEDAAGNISAALEIPFSTTSAAPTAYALTVSAGTGGRVSGTASGNYSAGTRVNLAAAPINSNYSFSGWSVTGVSVSNTPSISFVMPARSVTVTAIFTPNPTEPTAQPTPTAAQPGTTEPTTTEPDAVDPGATEPTTTEPDATEPDATEPTTTEPDATESATTEPDATQPGTTEPTTTESDTTGPGATEPGATEPDATEPGATQPNMTEPDVTEPATTQPNTTDPKATETGTTEPDATQPAVTKPDTPKPIVRPGGARPDNPGSGGGSPTSPGNSGGSNPSGGSDPRNGNGGGSNSGGGSRVAGMFPNPAEMPARVTWNSPFIDVNRDDWYYDSVRFAYQSGLFAETSPANFDPKGTMTRGMLVTVLWQLAGSPPADGETGLIDVRADAWYSGAVNWAAMSGIVSGAGGNLFVPDAEITRQDLAVILMNYLRCSGRQLMNKRTYSEFADSGNIAGYAKASVEALYKAGVVSGKPNSIFDPKSSATRAEIAVMLQRFIYAVIPY